MNLNHDIYVKNMQNNMHFETFCRKKLQNKDVKESKKMFHEQSVNEKNTPF